MHLQESTLFHFWPKVKDKHETLPSILYAPAKFEASMSKGLGGKAFTRNILKH